MHLFSLPKFICGTKLADDSVLLDNCEEGDLINEQFSLPHSDR